MMVAYGNGLRRVRGGAAAFGCAVLLVVATAAADTQAAGYSDALSWYDEQAEAGDVEAQYLLAFALEHGVHDAADWEAARTWYDKAAAQGHVRAGYRLALMMVEGRGGPADTAGAQIRLRPLAETGDEASQSLLGYLLAHDDNARRAEAYQWLDLAADGGDAFAAANLAVLLNAMTDAEVAEGDALIGAWRGRHQP